MPDESQQMFVGIDVSKARLDVAVLPTGEIFAVENTPLGITELLIRLTDVQPHLVVLEATGGLKQAAMSALHDAGLPVTVLNPRQPGISLGGQAPWDSAGEFKSSC